jgi:hypothetical protein
MMGTAVKLWGDTKKMPKSGNFWQTMINPPSHHHSYGTVNDLVTRRNVGLFQPRAEWIGNANGTM